MLACPKCRRGSAVVEVGRTAYCQVCGHTWALTRPEAAQSEALDAEESTAPIETIDGAETPQEE